MEGEIVRKCIRRTDKQCNVVDYMEYKVIYRRYASLFFVLGVDHVENDLAMLEFIHATVEALDVHFGNVCELDIMYQLGTVHFILDEMLSASGHVIDINRANVLPPVQVLASAQDSQA